MILISQYPLLSSFIYIKQIVKKFETFSLLIFIFISNFFLIDGCGILGLILWAGVSMMARRVVR